MGNDRFMSADLAVEELKGQIARARQGALYDGDTSALTNALESVKDAVQEIVDNNETRDPSEMDDLSQYTWAERALLLEQGRNKVDDKNDVRDSVKDTSSTEDKPAEKQSKASKRESSIPAE